MVILDHKILNSNTKKEMWFMKQSAGVYIAQEFRQQLISGTPSSNSMTKLAQRKTLATGLQFIRALRITQNVLFVNIILLCGDVSMNPGPTKDSTLCITCLKTIRTNQAYIDCSICRRQVHIKCLTSDEDQTGVCQMCTIPSDERIESLHRNIVMNSSSGLKNVVGNRGLKFVHQNIRSLTAKIDELRVLLSELQSGVHLLALTESWLTDNILNNELEIPGYRLFRKDRGYRGGGVATYIRNDVQALRRLDLEIQDVEGMWLEMCIPKSCSILVGVYYRAPNSSQYHDREFTNKFNKSLDLATRKGKEIILLGDFNCDFLKGYSTHPECKQLKTLFKIFNFIQLIKQPTRAISSTLIDLVVSNQPENISKAGVFCSGLSDRDMTYCVRKINWKRSPPRLKTVRNYAKYEASAFCEDLKDAFAANCSNTHGTTEELWSEFKTTFVTVTDKHVPYIQKKVRGVNSPWINQEIKQAIWERQYHLRKARETKTSEDKNVYTRLRNKVTRLIRVTKSNYFKRLVDDNSDNPKSFWKIIKSILPGEKTEVQPTIKVSGRLTQDKVIIANAFNKYFVGVVSTMLKNMHGLAKTTTDYLTSITTSDICFRFTPINEEFIIGQLKKMKTVKAAGLDGIHARVLKDSAEIIAKPLTTIVNSSLTTGCVPSDWKTARVTPIFKNGKTEDLNNYRPISVLPLVSKLLERAVHSQLYAFFTTNQLLSPYQHGFRKGHSTETATICFTHEVRRSIDQGLLTGSVFIDLRKAFDSVDHDILLNKLQAYGVRNGELQWFQNYLSNRVQHVSFHNTLSNAEEIYNGVPQGSILGPLLFVIFINDLPKALSCSKMLLYADDAVLFYAGKDVREIEKNLTNELHQIQ